MESNELNNEAEALFATKRKKQQEAEAERKRLEELEQQKLQMEAEVKRLEEIKAARTEQEAQWAREVQRAQQQTQPPHGGSGAEPGAGTASAKKGLNPKVKKIVLIAFAAIGVIISLLLVIDMLVDGGGEPEPEPEPNPAPFTLNGQIQSKPTPSDDTGDQADFNGHNYQFFDMDMTWTEARDYCIAQGGHLVTVTSPEEQEYLKNRFLNVNGGDAGPWLGAYSNGAFGGDKNDWRWVTGEEWGYTNWEPGEPSNSHGTEWYAHFWKQMLWNDVADDDPRNSQHGFICEFDGLSDEAAGGGYDDGSNLLYFNGHSYEYIEQDMPWMDAREYCRQRGGHLVTITSPEEQDFLSSNFYGQMLWIGAFGSETGWRWVTDEEWYYENWAPGEPNGYEEWCGCFWTEMQWNDLRNEDPGERISAFICEYDDFTDYGDY